MEGYFESKDIVESWKLMKNKYKIMKMIVMNCWVMIKKKDIFLALPNLFVKANFGKDNQSFVHRKLGGEY
jgi:hypothetical protein